MKLNKILRIDGKIYDFNGESLVIEEGAAGRAIFAVLATAPLSGVCTLAIGYGSDVKTYFSGVIRTCVPIDGKQQRITVSEFPAALNTRLPLALRNSRARDVLKALSDKCGITLITGNARIRIESTAVGHDRQQRRLKLQNQPFDAGQTIYIYTAASGYLERQVVEVDNRKNEIAYDRPIGQEIEISDTAPAKIAAYRIDGAPAWLDRRSGHFVSLGSGFEALRHAAAVFGMIDPVFLPQPDGALYVGNYQDAGAALQLLRFDTKIFTELSVSGASCPVIPALRPGQRITIGDSEPLRIRSVNISSNTMRIHF